LWDIRLPTLDIPQKSSEGGPNEETNDRTPVVDGIRITFTDHRWMILNAAGTVTRFDQVEEVAEPGVEVANLRVGEHIVVLDGDARKDVLAKVLEVAKEIPQLAAPATWVEYWRDALRRAKQRYGTYSALGEALRARGCVRETQTVRLWVIGHTIGPSDRTDVKRVGEALNDAALRDHHETVYRGIDAFRGAHAQLMQRVGALAMSVGTRAGKGSVAADEVIDERSGLTAADFRDCIEILQISAIDDVGLVPFATAGRIQEQGIEEK
jgi:hypothetical protein